MDKESYDLGYAEGKAANDIDVEVKAEEQYEMGYEEGKNDENERILKLLTMMIRSGL